MTGALLTPPLFLIDAAAAAGHDAEETERERERKSEEGKARVTAAGKTS
jgi:hypothetical protein